MSHQPKVILRDKYTCNTKFLCSSISCVMPDHLVESIISHSRTRSLLQPRQGSQRYQPPRPCHPACRG